LDEALSQLKAGIGHSETKIKFNLERIIMKRLSLLGLAALGLVVLAPIQSKAEDGFRVFIGPADQRPYYYREDYPRYRYYGHPHEYQWHRWHHRYDYNRD
jgi:hypothetical protein